jgi:hypothetical protein
MLTDLGRRCSGFFDSDTPDPLKPYIRCGNMFGVAISDDEPESIPFTVGEIVHQPIYTCASSVKATIKTVQFALNGTASLENLSVTQVVDKTYANTSSEPIWGVERPVLPTNVSNINLMWGLVNSSYINDSEIATIQAPALYLPQAHFLTDTSTFKDSMASASVFTSVWNSVIDEAAFIAGASVAGLPSYSGDIQYSLYLKWRNLSSTPEGAATIYNLIWTDIVASAVVGTNTGLEGSMTREVQKYHNVVSYDNLLFAIPAFIAMFIWLALFVVAVALLLLGRVSGGLLRHYLNQTSLGRAVYDATHRDEDTGTFTAKKWAIKVGDKAITLREYQPSQPVRLEPAVVNGGDVEAANANESFH